MPPKGSGKKVTAGTKNPPKTGIRKATKANTAQPLAEASGSGSVDPQIAPDISPPITPPPARRVAVFPTGEYVLPNLWNQSPGEDFGMMSDDQTPSAAVHMPAPILVSPIRARKPPLENINRRTDLHVWKLTDSEIIGIVLSLLLLLLF